ncbi:DUF6221 family protein [Streptomyces hirsutus]|uniref:DUF6221 family protein n=1 Tax=Streptomyces hirsutus TaxID=35620 RepID=UPI0036D18B6C
MDELVRWLGQQLDTDERIARAAADELGGLPLGGEWTYDGQYVLAAHERGLVAVGSQDFMTVENGRHIAEHDPARALREIDAKREVIAKYTKAVERMAELASLCERLKADGKDTFMPEMDRATAIHRRDVLHEVLQLHALPYADRPGFKESWRP